MGFAELALEPWSTGLQVTAQIRVFIIRHPEDTSNNLLPCRGRFRRTISIETAAEEIGPSGCPARRFEIPTILRMSCDLECQSNLVVELKGARLVDLPVVREVQPAVLRTGKGRPTESQPKVFVLSLECDTRGGSR